MAWIAIVPPSARHPRERYQVRYQDGRHERSADIYPTLRRAEAERRAIERNGRDPLPVPTEPDPAKAQTLFGEYVTGRWWPAWKDQHPATPKPPRPPSRAPRAKAVSLLQGASLGAPRAS